MIRDHFILLSPGSPRKKKKWSRERFAKLSDLILRNTEMKVVLLWGPKEYEDAHAVAVQSQENPVLAPPNDFHQAAAFITQCKLLICNDGGINHLSVALGAPSLAIFGNTSPQVLSAEGFFPNHYHMHNPKWQPLSDNTFGISSEDVFKKVQTILNHLNHS